ncbi:MULTISPECIES: DNA-binding protein [Calothrix]|uniref:DNA-binding protein n=2 Tax=Calothrix TaxID=1186 RepID=A0ABR8AAR3_9CYAN|nr:MULTISPECIES: DNA-binding protein [Calothrix]MBD2197076.1 DNA-binding protein [Calothrix parietina FACHB-288]MBD2225703.1 DNA-binding protein [Calothrix anomala FACHB-343]
MNTITINIPDEHLLKLQQKATRLGISVEELVLMGVEELLNQPETSFKDVMDYVLNKNAELYKRLA